MKGMRRHGDVLGEEALLPPWMLGHKTMRETDGFSDEEENFQGKKERKGRKWAHIKVEASTLTEKVGAFPLE